MSLLLAACDRSAAVSAPAATTPSTHAASTAPTAAPVVLSDYDSSTDPQGEIKKALAASAKDGKPVLVDFGADWCPDCVMLGKLGAKPQVQPVLTKFHVVSVDVGQFDKNLDVAKDLTVDLQTSGIPALVVLDSKGHVRTVTNDGSFSNARRMSPADVATFLDKWV